MSEFKLYKRKHHVGSCEMRPYIVGEDLTNVSVKSFIEPKEGGMIARNPECQWYVSKEYFKYNFE